MTRRAAAATPRPVRGAWLLGAMVGAGCAGPGRPAPAVHAAAPGEREEARLPYATPARWQYHPSEPEPTRSQLSLGDGSCILGTADGQRWRVQRGRGGAPDARRSGPGTDAGSPEASAAAAARPDVDVTCRGFGEAAADLAREDLVGIVRRSSGAWTFVGGTGTLYEARDPLGPFTAVIPAPEPLLRVSSDGSRLVGVASSGKLLRWADGAWTPAAGAPATVLDAVLDASGHGVALAMPERIFTTDDGGATWAPAGGAAPPPSIGAHAVGVDADGALVVEGLLESLRWDPRQPGLSRWPRAIEASPLGAVEVGRAPSAAAVLDGRAVIDGDRYVELVDVRPESDGEERLLARGRIDGRLSTRPLPWTKECASIRLGANGNVLLAACVRQQGDVIRVALRRSDDGGGSWKLGPELETPDASGIGVAVAPDGTALLTGVCRAGAQVGECEPKAPVVVRLEGTRLVASTGVAAALTGPPIAPAFSIQGATAYFVGRASGEDRLALFVSHDGGDTWSGRLLDRDPAPAPESDEEDVEGDEASFDLDVAQATAIHASEDGTLGITLLRPRGLVYVTADEDGNVLRVAEPPTRGAGVAGVGKRALAVALGADRAVRAWESMDGGARWAEIATTLAVERELFGGPSPLVCGAGGCLLGDTITRVGWTGQSEPPPRDPAPAGEAPREERAVLTPIRCEVAAGARWTRIAGIDAGASGPIPTQEVAARGRALWSVVTVDRARAAASTVAAMLPERGSGPPRVVTKALFAPAAPGARVALTRNPHQIEGYALARVRFEVDERGSLRVGAPMRDVEIAWENYMDGSAGRRTIPDAGAFAEGDVIVRRDDDREYDPGLVSVSPRSIFVRPHASSPSTFLLDPDRRADRFEAPVFPDRSLAGELRVRGDAALADGQILGTASVTLASGTLVWMLAHRSAAAGGWSVTATSILPGRADLVTWSDWTYAGKRLGVTAVVTTRSSSSASGSVPARATFNPFRGDGTFGPPEPIATPADLGPTPRPCGAAERATTPRLDPPLTGALDKVLFPGTRHPVLVDFAGAERASSRLVLLTGGSVVHGTPSSPCIAAWHAEEVAQGQARAILPGDLTHATLFRPVPDAARRGGRTIEYAPMTCRFDPDATVPVAVFKELGTSRLAH